MIGTSITTLSTLEFFIKLATVPSLSVNALKASLGLCDLIETLRWADTAFLPSDDIKRATGMSTETVLKSVDELCIVERVANGHRWTVNHPGQASEWIVNLQFPTTWTPWPTHYLSPANPQWDRRASALGPSAWHLAMACCDEYKLERASLANSDVRRLIGVDAKAASRALKAASKQFLSPHPTSRNTFIFEPDLMQERNHVVTRPLSDRETSRLAERNRLAGIHDASDRPEPPATIRPQRPGEDEVAYDRSRDTLQRLIKRITDKDQLRLEAGIRPLGMTAASGS